MDKEKKKTLVIASLFAVIAAVLVVLILFKVFSPKSESIVEATTEEAETTVMHITEPTTEHIETTALPEETTEPVEEENGLYYKDNILVRIDDSVYGEVEVREGTTEIAECVFSHSNITKITIPDSVKRFNFGSFEECEHLEEIIIGSGLVSLGDEELPFGVSASEIYPYAGLISLKKVEVSKDNKYFSSEDGVLYNKDKTCLILYPASKADSQFVLPESVIKIKNFAFYNTNFLEALYIHDNLQQYEKFSFLTVTYSYDEESAYGTDTGIGFEIYYTGSRSQWSAALIGEEPYYDIPPTIHYEHIETTTNPYTRRDPFDWLF
ncbi:MAG: leucine-rich repeat domain-containing protein [Clostridia bacterium]|nr:leucine-rich repeat domain-containing protein [Clostridia bacterium]